MVLLGSKYKHNINLNINININLTRKLNVNFNVLNNYNRIKCSSVESSFETVKGSKEGRKLFYSFLSSNLDGSSLFNFFFIQSSNLSFNGFAYQKCSS